MSIHHLGIKVINRFQLVDFSMNEPHMYTRYLYGTHIGMYNVLYITYVGTGYTNKTQTGRKRSIWEIKWIMHTSNCNKKALVILIKKKGQTTFKSRRRIKKIFNLHAIKIRMSQTSRTTRILFVKISNYCNAVCLSQIVPLYRQRVRYDNKLYKRLQWHKQESF